MRPLCHYLRLWDFSSSARVDQFVANSRYVAERIHKYYGRTSIVIPPPVAITNFVPTAEKGDYYLFFGELVSYKRADLAIEAFRASGRRLIVSGKGQQLEVLKKTAPPNVSFTGSLHSSEVAKYLANAKGLIFPGVEDFGIIPVEAMASGTPVVAFRKGGVLDTVIEDSTGILFDEQNIHSLNKALDRLEFGDHGISLNRMVSQAQKFSAEYFEMRFKKVVEDATYSTTQRLFC
jgi:glycosyltransferase involved in cell wall biosynthesis